MSEERMAKLREYVSKNGLKVTRQRELIAEVFFADGGHLSAEDLLAQVRAHDQRVSLATVYRTLKLLGESGLAEPHNFGDGQTRYEPAVGDEHHHDHIICVQCGKIVEFVNEDIERLQHEIATAHGFTLTDHRMELYGVCPDCQRA